MEGWPATSQGGGGVVPAPAHRAEVAILGVGLVLPDPQPARLPTTASERLATGPAYVCAELPLVRALPARAQRRLGRAQRLALGAAQQAMDTASCVPGPPERVAVLVGTGLGCLGETAAFLENLLRQEGREPMPARFINSVHNAPASQVSIAFGCRGECHTFSHESASFELALWQAVRLLDGGRADYALVVGTDEISAYAVTAGQECGWLRREAAPLAPLEDSTWQATLPGEGAAALLLGRAEARGSPGGAPRVAAASVRPRNGATTAAFLRESLAAAGAAPDEIGLYLFGANGDRRVDALYAEVGRELGGADGIRVGVFKHRCGEFGAASAIGIALAARAVRDRRLPPEIRCLSRPNGPMARIAVCHVHAEGTHSLCLVTA